jgi:hypothetical protein
MTCCLFAVYSRTPVPASASSDDAAKIVGRVLFRTHRDEPAEAILDEDGLWCCPQLPVLDRVLNILHSPKRTEGQAGAFGHAELERVAAWFQGTAKIRELPPRGPSSLP